MQREETIIGVAICASSTPLFWVIIALAVGQGWVI
jgi:hypothetical protein